MTTKLQMHEEKLARVQMSFELTYLHEQLTLQQQKYWNKFRIEYKYWKCKMKKLIEVFHIRSKLLLDTRKIFWNPRFEIYIDRIERIQNKYLE